MTGVPVRLIPIDDGDAGVAQTIGIMQRLVNDSLSDTTVIQAARNIVAGSGSRDYDAQAQAIRAWLLDHFTFVRDPFGQETIGTPKFQLDQIASQYYVQGDCDDVAVLAAALGKAVGMPAVFVTLGFDGPSGPFSHVYTALFGRTTWHSMDVTRPLLVPVTTRRAEWTV